MNVAVILMGVITVYLSEELREPWPILEAEQWARVWAVPMPCPCVLIPGHRRC